MRKQTRSFKPGESIHTLQAWLHDVLGGEIESGVTVTLQDAPRTIDVYAVCASLDLVDAVEHVVRFAEYRRHEIGKPIRSDAGLRRLLVQFEDDPSSLKSAVQESMAQGWQGLFKRSAGKGSGRSRAY